MGIGAGYYFVSSSASIMVFLILAVLPILEDYIELLNVAKTYSITIPYAEKISAYYEGKLKSCKLKYRVIKHVKDEGVLILVWETQGHSKYHAIFIAKMIADNSINKFEYY